ncbi:TPA: DUF1627 domain-containing protein [Escherichia coli]|nr:DUF1627 domain-containing protein [Escherichia coli]
MKIKHEHIESVLFALAAEKGQAWVANAITEEYLRQGGGELPLVPGKDWNNQQNIYHRWLKGETKTQREKIQKLIPAILAILPRELRHRLCIFDNLILPSLHMANRELRRAKNHVQKWERVCAALRELNKHRDIVRQITDSSRRVVSEK